MNKFSILVEFWEFIKVRKKMVAGADYFLCSFCLVLLIVLTEGSALAPFVYTLF